jgi:hypothetical protein
MRKLLALNDMATAKKQYKDMRLKCGKPESSFAYLFDKALQAVGCKSLAYHSGDLEGHLAQQVMKNLETLFNELKTAAKNSRDDSIKFSYRGGNQQQVGQVQYHVYTSWVIIFFTSTDSSD